MSWLQLCLAVTPDQAVRYEEYLLNCGAVSVTFMDAEDQPIFEPALGTTPLWQHTWLLALFEGDIDQQQLLLMLTHEAGEKLPLYKFEKIEDQDWERTWMDNFHPMQFGNRLWIVPSWCEIPDTNAINLLLDPGLAFGTGTHPTTALCLQWLDQYMQPDLTVIDFGCGSGILAIAALLLGAKHVVGTDIDIQALEASRENAKRNQIADDSFSLFLPNKMPTEPADVVLANILAGPLVALAPQLTALTKINGWLCLSGILEDQAIEVCTAYQNDFDLQPVVIKEGWARIVGCKKSIDI